ncbi:MAG: hypothetical protein GY923_22065 [Aestuariibacter sp.]|nr:hypothetical protein [Aestuariibacter sp.]
MKKPNIEEFVRFQRLRNIYILCMCLGMVSWFLALSFFPVANRNPKSMATSAFSALQEVGWMTSLVVPMLVTGLVFFTCGIILKQVIKRKFGENEK